MREPVSLSLTISKTKQQNTKQNAATADKQVATDRQKQNNVSSNRCHLPTATNAITSERIASHRSSAIFHNVPNRYICVTICDHTEHMNTHEDVV